MAADQDKKKKKKKKKKKVTFTMLWTHPVVKRMSLC